MNSEKDLINFPSEYTSRRYFTVLLNLSFLAVTSENTKNQNQYIKTQGKNTLIPHVTK